MARTTIKGIVSKTWTAGGSFGDVYKMSVISNGAEYIYTIPETVLKTNPYNPNTNHITNLHSATQMIPTQTKHTIYATKTNNARLRKTNAYEHATSLVQTYLNQEQQQIVGERLLGLR
ncbi:MAG: hypothetical protein E6Q97_28065 [Desulfurellales bacterium]|nr:MAG: hypothetical protein E6Q97_28065 [Desulfurellales bacterium]